MSHSKSTDHSSAIAEAIRANREHGGKSKTADEIARLEAELLADIESFDLDAAERRARREVLARSDNTMADSTRVFSEIAPPPNTPRAPGNLPSAPAAEMSGSLPAPTGAGLLDQLRFQAKCQQQEKLNSEAARTATNEAIDQALKYLFFYLHDFVQQLNILKPAVNRSYPVIEKFVLSPPHWVEGFADYRTQSQSAGALVELVTMSFRQIGSDILRVERHGPSVERFRKSLFDFGLPFTCQEFRNERRYVEKAYFEIRNDISVSARWRADFDNGMIVIETRNLERLGSTQITLLPQHVDEALLDNFGRLVLGQPNRFRELAKRP